MDGRDAGARRFRPVEGHAGRAAVSRFPGGTG
jgi:hypothetical protein